MCKMRRQSSGRKAHHSFMLSGFAPDRKVQLSTKIQSLGGIYNETDHFEIKCTHIVCKKPSKSEKFLGGCATGKWIMTPQYIDESYTHGRWLAEAPYEWGPRWREGLDPTAKLFLHAPAKWRNKVQRSGHGAFLGWRAAVLVDHITKRTVYTRLLELGGASLVPVCPSSPSKSLRGLKSLPSSLVMQAESLTHVFVEGRAETLILPLTQQNVFCLQPLYIGDFLLLEECPGPQEYLVSCGRPPDTRPPITVKQEPEWTTHRPSQPGHRKTLTDQRNLINDQNTSLKDQKFPHNDHSSENTDPASASMSNGFGEICVHCQGERKKNGTGKVSQSASGNTLQQRHQCVCTISQPHNTVVTTGVQKFYNTDCGRNKGSISRSSSESGPTCDKRIKAKLGVKTGQGANAIQNCSKDSGEDLNLGLITGPKFRRGKKRLSDENHPVERKTRKCDESAKIGRNRVSTVGKDGDVANVSVKTEKTFIFVPRPVTDNASPVPSPYKRDSIGLQTPVKTRSSVNMRNKKGSKDSPSLQRFTQSSLFYFVTRAKSETLSPVSTPTTTPLASPQKQVSKEMQPKANCKQTSRKPSENNSSETVTRSRGWPKKVSKDTIIKVKRVESPQVVKTDSDLVSRLVNSVLREDTSGDLRTNCTHCTGRSDSGKRQRMQGHSCVCGSPVKITFKAGYMEKGTPGQVQGTNHLVTHSTSCPDLKGVVLKLNKLTGDDLTLYSSQGSNSSTGSGSLACSQNTDKKNSPQGLSRKSSSVEISGNLSQKSQEGSLSKRIERSDTVGQKSALGRRLSSTSVCDSPQGSGDVSSSQESCVSKGSRDSTRRKSARLSSQPKKNSDGKEEGDVINIDTAHLSMEVEKSVSKKRRGKSGQKESGWGQGGGSKEVTTPQTKNRKSQGHAGKAGGSNGKSPPETPELQDSVAVSFVQPAYRSLVKAEPLAGSGEVGPKVGESGPGVGQIGPVVGDTDHTRRNLWPPGGTEERLQAGNKSTERLPAGNISTKSLTEDEVSLYASVHVRNNKLQSRSYGLAIVDLTTTIPQLDTKPPHAFPQSENCTALFEACFEEGLLSAALEMLSSSVSTVRYPQARTLHTVIKDILMGAESAVHREKASFFLYKLLSQHPPSSPALQDVYLGALSSKGSPAWVLVCSAIRESLTEARKGQREFCALRFLVRLFQLEFQLYQHRLYTLPPPHKPSLWGRVLWPGGALSQGQLNSSCLQLLGLFVDAFSVPDSTPRVELVTLLQSLVAMTAESCRLSFPAGGSLMVFNLASDRLQLFSRELVRRARSGLDWTKTGPDAGLELLLGGLPLPWLACLVCEHLLENFDESLLPLVSVVDDRGLTLNKIVSKYFYLLPPLCEVASSLKSEQTEDSQGFTLTPRNSSFKAPTLSRGSTPVGFAGQITPSKMTPSKLTPSKLTPSKLTPSKLTPSKLTPSKVTPIKIKPENVNKRNTKGETTLHRACIRNNLPRIQELLQIPGVDVNLADHAGWTPLHECCNYGYVEAVSTLLHYRPPPSITTFFSKEGEERRRVNLLACSEEGITPLHDAVTNNHCEVVRLLLEHGGKKLLEVKTRSGQTAVDMATSPEMLQLLQQNTFSRSPIKRKYAPPSEFILSQNYLSQTMTQNSDFSPDTYQPAKNVYSEVLLTLAGTTRYADSTQIKQYVLLIFHLLKNYLDLHELIPTFNTCRQHDEGSLNLAAIVKDEDLRKFGLAKGKPLAGVTKSLANDIAGTMATDHRRVSERSRRKQQTKNRSPESEVARQEVPVVKDYRKALLEDLEVYKELKYHIRGFRSHLKMISRKKDSKEAFDCQLRLLLLAMRALYVN